MLTIYHNPRCSKSREALALVEQFASNQGLPVEIIEYLKTPPTIAQLLTLHRQLGGTVRDMVRSNEDEYAELDLGNADDTGLLAAMTVNPKLLQRPIVVYKDRAAIGRPPEVLIDFLKSE
ncbi:MAG TPA: arsenate reductase (glutaredoxin) [Noviherbaspirillum sp.]